MDGPRSPKRRSLLRRGVVLLAGAVGLVTAEQRMGGQVVAAPSRQEPAAPFQSTTLKLYGRRWRPQPQAHLLGRRSEGGDHIVGYGELLEAPDGALVGRFCTNGFCPDFPLGHTLAASPTIEFQTLTLNGGTLFGMAAADPDAGSEKTYAILGGTGRFAGARGTYAARMTSAEPFGRGTVEFILTLTA
jgi:Dirigent-like protein